MLQYARAEIAGDGEYGKIKGTVVFEKSKDGVIVKTEVYGLPPFSRSDGKTVSPFGFHLHEGGSCGGKDFADTGSHYNPTHMPHGNHPGDFPVLIPTSKGVAAMAFLTDKFTIDEIVGKTIVIHLSPDDYHTQPSGGSGTKIACGVVKKA